MFYFVFESNSSNYNPLKDLYSEGRFNGEFFALPVWGAYIWRGLFSEFCGVKWLISTCMHRTFQAFRW